MSTERPPLPPFITRESAALKVRLAEDAWNSRDPERVSLAYTHDSRWRNRDQFINGHEDIFEFLASKWAREQETELDEQKASRVLPAAQIRRNLAA